MTQTYTNMFGPEFIKKVMDGNREFTRIKLPLGTKLSEDPSYPEFIEYLQRKDSESRSIFESRPIYLEGASLVGLVAKGLNLPYLVADGADFSGANLEGATLDHGDFHNANFSKADLRLLKATEACFNNAYFNGENNGANLWLANLYNCYFYDANLNNANLRKASFRRCRFRDADFNGADIDETVFSHTRLLDVKNFDKTKNLAYTFFNKAMVTDEMKEYILDIRNQEQKRIDEENIRKGNTHIETREFVIVDSSTK
jgi:hypothetical protein